MAILLKVFVIYILNMLQADNFIDSVLNDVGRNTFYLPINITSPTYSGEVVIENSCLFSHFSKTQGLNIIEYKKLMKNYYKHKGNISIKIDNIDKWEWKWNLITVLNDKRVLRNVRKGKEKFLKIYFKGSVLKKEIPEEQKGIIINQLFKWGIKCKRDCESGYLIIR